MPRLKNDTHLPPEERARVPFSSSDLVIPTAICSVVSVLLFLAFEPEAPNQDSPRFVDIRETTTASLMQQQRTAEVAAQLIRREDVSIETAKACLTRLATLKRRQPSDVCLQIIRDLPHNISLAAERKWTALLQEHVSKANLESIIQNHVNQEPSEQRFSNVQLAWAAIVSKSPDQIPAIFESAALDSRHMANLLQAIPIIVDSNISRQCGAEIKNWIFKPACQHPEQINHRLVLAAIECISKIPINPSSKVSTYCELAIAGVCQPDCFAELQRLGVHSIPIVQQGPIAAAVLQYLADRNKHKRQIRCRTTWTFAEDLSEVFLDDRKQRYESRLLEIHHTNDGAQKQQTSATQQAPDSI